MTLKYIISIMLLSFFFMLNLSAQGDVISIEEFVELRKNTDNLVVIDASKPSLYNKAHMKGAINIPYEALNEPETDDNVFGMLLPPDKMAAFLGKKGVSEKDMIVVYDEETQKYSTRVYWALKYLGADNVRILHKKNTEWRKARIKLTSAPTKLKPKTFSPVVEEGIASNLDFMEILDTSSNVVVLDVRSEKEFTGIDPEMSLGHIPGSILLYYKKVLKEDKSFLDRKDLELLVAENNFSKDTKYVVYCNTGIKAAVVYVALKEILKFPDVRIYDGGYYEWEAFEMPIVK